MRILRSLLGLAVVVVALAVGGCRSAPSPIRVPGLVKVMRISPAGATALVGYEFDNGGDRKWLVTAPEYGASVPLLPGESLQLSAIPVPTNPQTGGPSVIDGATLCEFANKVAPDGKPWTLHEVVPDLVTSSGPCPQ